MNASYQIIYLLVVTLSLSATTFAEEPGSAAYFRMWAERTIVRTADEAEEIPGIRFSRIKQREPEIDGYRWLHGVVIVRDVGELFATWGHNRGEENNATEIAQARRSKTDGESWEQVELVSSGGPSHTVSHGVFLSRDHELWLFCGRF